MYDTILVPTDGSDHSIRAGTHACQLASTFDATLCIVNVADVEAAAGLFTAGDAEFVDRLEKAGQAAIEAVLEAIEEPPGTRTEVVHGTPSEAILEFAAEHDVDLIAMGTHGRTGVRRYLAGSVTERVVRLSEAPVLTVRATGGSELGGGYEAVLVPTDGSAAAAAAADHGLAIAERTGATVHALTVTETGGATDDPGAAAATGSPDGLESARRRAAEEIVSRARSRDIEAVSSVATGEPADQIRAYATEQEVDLIAMGTAGRTGVERYLLGSTTEQVLRHVPMPVLAVSSSPAGE